MGYLEYTSQYEMQSTEVFLPWYLPECKQSLHDQQCHQQIVRLYIS